MKSSCLPGLYVHVPFCLTKCPYCDFFSQTDLSTVDAYIDAIVQEASLYSNRFSAFDSLYVGGGTPSVLEASQVVRLFSGLRSCFDFDPSPEVTFEVNPDDVTIEKLHTLRSEGVTRLSIGVQSFRDRDLRFLKRRHDGAAGRKAMESAFKAGFEDVSIDLIYALPGQTKASWVSCLEQAVSHPVSHISCYQLTIEKETPFGRLREQGSLQRTSEKKERDLFILTSQFLQSHGFQQYEISNYAKGTSFSRHNVKYWTHVPYLGLGPSAHSFDGTTRWWNGRSVLGYCGSLEEGRLPVAGREELTKEQLRLERLYLGFRTKMGVARRDLEDSDKGGQTLSDLVNAGLLEMVGDCFVPSLKGYLIADYLPLLFE